MEAPLSEKGSSDFLSTYSPSNCNTSDIIPFIHSISFPVSQEELAKMIVLCLLSSTPTTVDSHMNRRSFFAPMTEQTSLHFSCSPHHLPQCRYCTAVLNKLCSTNIHNGCSRCPHFAKISLHFLPCVT